MLVVRELMQQIDYIHKVPVTGSSRVELVELFHVLVESFDLTCTPFLVGMFAVANQIVLDLLNILDCFGVDIL